jgi:hypothetical protein
MIAFRWPLLAACLLLAGCSERSFRAPSLDADGAARQALAEYDADKDGALAGPELEKCPGLKAGLRVLDTNKDGKINADELTARIRKYQTDNLGLYSVYVDVTLDGKSLGDAVVTLVPEKFMGSGVKQAQGTTSAAGSAELRMEGAERSGVHPGVYRIEVSKKDAGGQEMIPSKYNTSTTLGIEVGMGSRVLQEAVELKLSKR